MRSAVRYLMDAFGGSGRLTMRNHIAASSLLFCLWLAAGPASAACGKVSIAEMNWGSAAIIAHIDAIILERGFGCTVTIVPGDTVPTFETMNGTGKPDLAPEFWVNAVRGELARATGENRLATGAETLADGAVEGWWIPKFIADANPEIRSVRDALARPDLFPASAATKGAVHGCPKDWACHASTANLFKAFGAKEANFELIEPETAEALDASIAKAFETKTGWLGYHWAPTAILGRYQMVKLSFGVPHDAREWEDCTVVPDCANPQPNAYPISRAFVLYTQGFAEKAEPALAYMGKRQWSNGIVSSLLAWQQKEKASNRQTAEYFLENHEEIWSTWVSPIVAGQVRKAR